MDVVTLGIANADAKKKYVNLPPAAWFCAGDSIMRGAGDTSNYLGFFRRACEDRNFGYIFCPFFGEQAANLYDQRFTRFAAMEYTTHCLDEYDRNDFTSTLGNKSAAVVEANDLKRWQCMRDRQQVVFATTTTPYVSSTTNAYGSVAGMTADANDANRILRNDWLRAGAPCLLGGDFPTPTTAGNGAAVFMGQPGHPLSGYFELADAIESSRNSGKLKAAERFFTDGVMSPGTNILTSATAAFTLADVGKLINVAGAGGGSTMLSVTISQFDSATQVRLSNTASVNVTGAACAIDPWTADGVHPTPKGHIALAAVTDLAGAVAKFPPRVAREWIPMAYNVGGYNAGFSSGVRGGTSRIQHKIVPGRGYSAVRMAYANWVGPFPAPQSMIVAASVDYQSRSNSARFNGQLTTTLLGGQPLVVSDPISFDVRRTAGTPYLYSRTYIDAGASTAQIPLSNQMSPADGDGHNYSASGGADLTGSGWLTNPANPPGAGIGACYAPIAILGKVAA